MESLPNPDRLTEVANAMAGVTRAEGVTNEEWFGAIKNLWVAAHEYQQSMIRHHGPGWRSRWLTEALARFRLLEEAT